MRYPILATMLSPALMLGGCSAADAAPVEHRNFTVAGFDRIELAAPYEVEVRVGGTASVRAEGERDSLDRLSVTTVGNRLVIRQTRGLWSFAPSQTAVRLKVSVPSLRAVLVSGSGMVTADRVRGPDFTASVAGSGGLRVPALQVEQARVQLMGSGMVALAGQAERLAIDLAGSGTVDTAGLPAATLTVKLEGSGGVKAAASGDASLTVTGSGTVDVAGKARCKVSRLGSGTVTCGG